MASVLVHLPDLELARARAAAEREDRPLDDLLSLALKRGLDDVEGGPEENPATELDLSGLTDDQLSLHIFASLPAALHERLSELRYLNSEGQITPEQLAEFDRLLRVCHTSNLLKTRALIAWRERHGTVPEPFQALA
jgi:hypothetical protein